MQAIKTVLTVVLTTLQDEFSLFFVCFSILCKDFSALFHQIIKCKRELHENAFCKWQNVSWFFIKNMALSQWKMSCNRKLYDKTWNKSLISWRRNVNIFFERRIARFVTSIKVFNSSLLIFSSRKEMNILRLHAIKLNSCREIFLNTFLLKKLCKSCWINVGENKVLKCGSWK